jgi:twitching motility protein PilT
MAGTNRPGDPDAQAAVVALELETVFRDAVLRKASDILITAGAPVAFRLKDEIQQVKMTPLTAEESQKLIYEMLNPDQIARFERDLELDFSITYDGKHRFRGNVFRQRGAIGAALRLIPQKVPTMEELNLPPIVRELALKDQGLILVTGATGHGKSTTQAAMLNLINNTRRAHIITIEDPVEFIFANKSCIIEQREVGDDTRGFAEALKHVLRQNPDVVLVGEMRDLESIGAALTAAETGHLVISTLHTNDAVSAINRLVDIFPPHQQPQIRVQLSMVLVGVLAQRLVPLADQSGLVLATEVLMNNSGVANLIREGKIHQIYTIMETHSKDGMITMDMALRDLYLTGAVTLEAAKSRMKNPQLI